MKIVQKLFGVLFAGLVLGVAAQGCAVSTDSDEPFAEAEQVAKSAQAVCPTTEPGRPIPPDLDTEFNACVATCKASGNTTVNCKRSCCTAYTGCSICYHQ